MSVETSTVQQRIAAYSSKPVAAVSKQEAQEEKPGAQGFQSPTKSDFQAKLELFAKFQKTQQDGKVVGISPSSSQTLNFNRQQHVRRSTVASFPPSSPDPHKQTGSMSVENNLCANQLGRAFSRAEEPKGDTTPDSSTHDSTRVKQKVAFDEEVLCALREFFARKAPFVGGKSSGEAISLQNFVGGSTVALQRAIQRHKENNVLDSIVRHKDFVSGIAQKIQKSISAPGIALMLREAPQLLLSEAAVRQTEGGRNMTALHAAAMHNGILIRLLEEICCSPANGSNSLDAHRLRAFLSLEGLAGSLLHGSFFPKDVEEEIMRAIDHYRQVIFEDEELVNRIVFKTDSNGHDILHSSVFSHCSSKFLQFITGFVDQAFEMPNIKGKYLEKIRLTLGDFQLVLSAAQQSMDTLAVLLGWLGKYDLLLKCLAPSSSGVNIFHRFVSQCRDYASIESTVSCIRSICAAKFLFERRDKDHHTPFLRAIKESNADFINYVSDTMKAGSEFASILTCGDETKAGELAITVGNLDVLDILFGHSNMNLPIRSGIFFDEIRNIKCDVALLLVKTACPDILRARSNLGCNLMCSMIQSGRIPAASYLISQYSEESLAMLAEKDCSGKTALHPDNARNVVSLLRAVQESNPELAARVGKPLFDDYVEFLISAEVHSYQYLSQDALLWLLETYSAGAPADPCDALYVAIRFRVINLVKYLMDKYIVAFETYQTRYGSVFEHIVCADALHCIIPRIINFAFDRGIACTFLSEKISHESNALELLLRYTYDANSIIAMLPIFKARMFCWQSFLTNTCTLFTTEIRCITTVLNSEELKSNNPFDNPGDPDVVRVYHDVLQKHRCDVVSLFETLLWPQMANTDNFVRSILADADGTPSWVFILRNRTDNVLLFQERIRQDCPCLGLTFSEDNTTGLTFLHFIAKHSLDISLRDIDFEQRRAAFAIDTQDSDGRTPLHLACDFLQIEHLNTFVSYMLRDLDANPNTRDSKGETPLMRVAQKPMFEASERNHMDEVIRTLLRNGADPYIANNDGEMPSAMPHVSSLIEEQRISETQANIATTDAFVENLSFDRNQIVQQLFDAVNQQSNILKARWSILFKEERGIDQGALLSDLICNFHAGICGLTVDIPHDFILFESEEDGTTFLPKKNARADLLYLFGKILARNYLLDERATCVPYNTVLFILLWQSDVRNTKEFLSQFNNSIAREFCPKTVQSLENLVRQKLGTGAGIEWEYQLQPGGPIEIIEVTDNNKEMYMKYHLWDKVLRERFASLFKIREGFRDFVRLLFGSDIELPHPQELRLRICGEIKLTGNMVASVLLFIGFDDSSKTQAHLTEIVREELSKQQLKDFLKFACGFSALPVSWLATVREEHNSVNVRKMEKSDRLPEAHACFFYLDLPDYNDKDVLRQKLS